MSKLTTFSPLTKLRPFKDNWRVRVKCLHSWKQTTTFGGDTFEMIFADEWGNKIQATCKRTLIYEQIENGTLKAPFLIDVIGRVHELGDVQTVHVSGENRKRVQFRLVDAEGNNIACCLWGTYAEQLEPFTENTKDQKIVCLIRFAKISSFRGELQITNAFDASLMYLNPVIPEIADLTQRLSDDHQSLAVVYKQKGKESKRIVYNWDDAEIKSISEVNEANQSIIGVPAVDLWDGSYEEIEDPEILPSAIISLVGKSFCFGVSIGSDNVTNGALTFVVLDVFSGDKVLSIETKSQKISETGTSSSTMSSSSGIYIRVALILSNMGSTKDSNQLQRGQNDLY
ncbi:hypothetical protein DY000_02004989 [Brassica cretica]|uniref:DUF223 domain-containing protein n=1 Tax=Brassica cretica TaxID=69181 RepID=A0ABQ7BTM1_BRACR|nr:hypothetical protein DY000_02004989 [Brassica cretica]